MAIRPYIQWGAGQGDPLASARLTPAAKTARC